MDSHSLGIIFLIYCIQCIAVDVEDVYSSSIKKNTHLGLGALAHAYNPSTLRGQGRQITKSGFETSLANMMKSRLYQKYKN